MGAGSKLSHNVQDAAEIYLTFKLQLELEKNNKHVSLFSDTLKQEFDDYLSERGITFSQFYNHAFYATNILKRVKPITKIIMDIYPDKYLDIRCVEGKYRNMGKKGDFVIIRSNERIDDTTYDWAQYSHDSVSLKNQSQHVRYQCCSGTFVSFLLNMIYERNGPGQFIIPGSQTSDNPDGETFTSRRDLSNEEFRTKISMSDQVYDAITQLKKINQTYRNKFIEGDFGKFWSQCKDAWKQDCSNAGKEATGIILSVLNSLPKKSLKKRVLKMCGFDNEAEELLVLSKEGFIFSMDNTNFKDVINRVNQDDYEIRVIQHCKSIRFNFVQEGSETALFSNGICDVPMTLQKNGAWWLPKTKHEGTKNHEKEKCQLAYGQRRPKKSRELNTSTNCFVDMRNLGIIDRKKKNSTKKPIDISGIDFKTHNKNNTLSTLKLDKLKQYCRDNCLRVGGKKAEVVNRIIKHIKQI